jgi:transcription initiation factor TFIIIB Brf1 subunit/transcription initiation factor TFIIB
MSEAKLRPCPFCGSEMFVHSSGEFWCKNEDCVLYDYGFLDGDEQRWNTRPIEDELIEASSQAKEMLLHIGGCHDTVNKLEAALKKAQKE